VQTFHGAVHPFALPAELVADEQSIVGTENAGIISADVLTTEAEEAAANGTTRGRRSAGEPNRAEEPNRTEKDTE